MNKIALIKSMAAMSVLKHVHCRNVECLEDQSQKGYLNKRSQIYMMMKITFINGTT